MKTLNLILRNEAAGVLELPVLSPERAAREYPEQARALADALYRELHKQNRPRQANFLEPEPARIGHI